MDSKDSRNDQMLMTMERELTGSQKAGFFFLGFFGGIIGVLAASLMNINAPYRPEGTRMAPRRSLSASCSFSWAVRLRSRRLQDRRVRTHSVNAQVPWREVCRGRGELYCLTSPRLDF